MANSTEALIAKLVEARAALAVKKRYHLKMSGDHFGAVQMLDRDDKELLAMLARYGYKEPQGEQDTASGQLTNDELAAKWIIEYGSIATARMWTEWLVNNKVIESPATVAAVLDRFPMTLRQQYNADRNKAIEALRAQLVSWIEKNQTKLRYADAKIWAAKPETNTFEAFAALAEAVKEWSDKKETA
ncbi:MAG TPA: hypothetical protein VMU38_10840 [Candidatus Binatia bacterium]|nr:hypothetical protein [Candidatus Binatia bacterium]